MVAPLDDAASATDPAELSDDDNVIEEQNKTLADRIKRWVKRQLSSPSTTAAAVLILMTTIIALYKRYHSNGRRRRLITQQQQATKSARSDRDSYASAAVVPLSLLLAAAKEGRLQKALLGSSRILFQMSSDNKRSSTWNRVDVPTNPSLQKEVFATISKSKCDISTLPESDYSQVTAAIFAVLPFVYLAMVYRLMRNQLGGEQDADARRKQVHGNSQKITTFRDVAGLDSVVTEISEVVEYLRNPRRYRQLGATSPRGILLHGPPGTGKTLLAQAVAGEARVDCFLACSASDFVEMYVGRGAARVRSLFSAAKDQAVAIHRRRNRRAAWRRWFHRNVLRTKDPSIAVDTPCCSAIIFIDELDALAKRRSTFGSNDEREQTLNQLLTEMDGFRKTEDVTVIIMAASNRADVLDPAILRRFDRQIQVGYPDAAGRHAILSVHARNIPFAVSHSAGGSQLKESSSKCVDWKSLAADKVTGGMSGAELRNLVNEAALLAVREGSNAVTQQHLEHAARRIRQMKTGSLLLSDISLQHQPLSPR